MQEFLTTKQVAAMADRSGDAVRVAVRLGRLVPVGRTSGGVALFTRAQAQEWARTRTHRATQRAEAGR